MHFGDEVVGATLAGVAEIACLPELAQGRLAQGRIVVDAAGEVVADAPVDGSAKRRQPVAGGCYLAIVIAHCIVRQVVGHLVQKHVGIHREVYLRTLADADEIGAGHISANAHR